MIVYYTFRVVDDAGALVAGATLATSALVRLSDGTAITGVAQTYTPLGGGDYSVGYDVDANPEALLQISASKAGSTISGQNALIPVVLARTVLSATGLDALLVDVASDSDMRSSGAKMLRAVFNRFFNKVTNSASTQGLNNDAGTQIATMAVSDDGTTATKARSA